MRLAALFVGVSGVLLGASGCGLSPFPTDAIALVGGSSITAQSQIVASVTSTNPDTGLPATLSGTLSGTFEGTYEEEILEIFFDSEGVPVAALSRSEFTAASGGTLISLNLAAVVDLILLTDESGAPVLDEQNQPLVTGLHTAATGEIIYGSGPYEKISGQLRTDSILDLSGGEFGLGSLDSEFSVTLNLDTAN